MIRFPGGGCRRVFKTELMHTERLVGFMEYEQIRQSAKMRLCRALSSVVFALLRDGIEKVRGSTPLISTIQNRAKARFFAFREWGTGCLGHPGSGASSRGAPLQRAGNASLNSGV